MDAGATGVPESRMPTRALLVDVDALSMPTPAWMTSRPSPMFAPCENVTACEPEMVIPASVGAVAPSCR